ncbi:Outer membrane protein assembly factor BamB precursor [Posidoniimonas corsicana]|uniref:Outer membrane protein assembly factor BamB n=1 Tax=Posidoniimonas corsicana TaxID=1938618 RepID=A0A5C5V6W5_9BACT|nr:PQQ-binding-like beta-propeller repeat protein [Posidoniimonas corsicana]TWT33475.1 Outer membrane protein assembly factor BamB precursor [Posidoniimonas corsicana]
MLGLTRRRFTQLLTSLPAVRLVVGGRASPAATATGAGAVTDFAFVHLSDTHLDPRPRGQAYNNGGRSVSVLDWFAERAVRPLGADAAPSDGGPLTPEFAIHTGDVFEYSIVDDCWSDWDRAVEGAGLPIYCVPGNHDNTWSSISRYLRERHGGDSYSFDRHGVHFVCLNSAGSLDPLPAIDQRTLRWLRADLESVPVDTPIILSLHHPLSGNSGYASEYDKLRLWDALRRHNLRLMLDGHWHQVDVKTWQNTPRINGGETFRKNPGYATVAVSGGVLTHRYHFHDTAEGGPRDVATLRLPLDAAPVGYRAVLRARTPRKNPDVVRLNAWVEAIGAVNTHADPRVVAFVDDDNASRRPLRKAKKPKPAPNKQPGTHYTATLPTDGLTPGRHFAKVRIAAPGQAVTLDTDLKVAPQGVVNEQAVEFTLPDRSGRYAAAAYQNDAGVKTPLLLTESAGAPATLLFGDTAGTVTALDADSLQPRWRRQTGREILHSLALAGGHVLAGDSDGVLWRLDAGSGEVVSSTDLPAPLFAPPLVIEDHAYLGDANGAVHAINLTSGQPGWKQDVASFAFEAAPTYYAEGDLLIGGAWDGRIYALDRQSGEVAWSAAAPTGQVQTKSRYYSAADGSPVLVGDELWIVDRGYRLGRYAAASGEFLGLVQEKAAGVTPIGGDSTDLCVTHLDDRVSRRAVGGEVLWEQPVETGRCPRGVSVGPGQPGSPSGDPTLCCVSDRGLMTLLSAADGRVLHRYSATPRLFVLAPPTSSPSGRQWWVAGMDGVVTRVQQAVDA